MQQFIQQNPFLVFTFVESRSRVEERLSCYVKLDITLIATAISLKIHQPCIHFTHLLLPKLQRNKQH